MRDASATAARAATWVAHPLARGWAAAAVGVLLLASFALRNITARPTRPAEPDAAAATSGRPGASALDPNRVAVFYFQDRSADHRLQYLADGLTEELIRELTGILPLRVLSQDAVRPFRGRDDVPLDSVARALRAGTYVSATVREDGQRVHLVARVVDAATGDQLAADTVARPLGEPAALASDLAARVAGMLRPMLGDRRRHDELRQERPGVGARNRALELVFQAQRLRSDAAAARLAPGANPRAVETARDSLRVADSLLALAERVDRTWPRPAIERGWVAVTAGRLEHGTARVVALSPGLAHAERALTLLNLKAPVDSATLARALHLRGAVRIRTATAVQTFRPESTTLRAGMEDLRAAVAIDSTLAGAWAMLSQAERVAGEFEESEEAAEKALAADAYLNEGPDVIELAWRSAAAVGRHADAERWCARGRQLVPNDWHFVECELALMRDDAAGISNRRPNPARAWELMRELERMDPASRARAAGHPYSPVYRRMVVAAVLAAADQRDSARAMLSRTLDEVRGDPELATDVLYDAAFLRFVLGDRAAAERDLAAYLRARPDLADLLKRDNTLAAVRNR